MIESIRELENARRKLEFLERQYEAASRDVDDDEELREIELESLRGLINQFKEEIARFESHMPASAKSE